MSSTTTVIAVIYAYQPGTERDVLDVLIGYDLTGGMTETIELDEVYMDDTGRGGSSANIATELAALGATFQCWEEPYGEWLGDVHLHVPGLGMFSAECDAAGAVVFGTSEVLNMVIEATSLAGLRAEVAKVTGTPWLEAINALRVEAAVAAGQG